MRGSDAPAAHESVAEAGRETCSRDGNSTRRRRRTCARSEGQLGLEPEASLRPWPPLPLRAVSSLLDAVGYRGVGQKLLLIASGDDTRELGFREIRSLEFASAASSENDGG